MATDPSCGHLSLCPEADPTCPECGWEGSVRDLMGLDRTARGVIMWHVIDPHHLCGPVGCLREDCEERLYMNPPAKELLS